MIAFRTHFSFEFFYGLRNPSQLLMNYLFPLVFYAMMGSVMTQLNPLFKETIIPSMIVLSAMTSTILGMPGPVVQFREAGVYRSYKINGVPALSILAIPALTAMFHVGFVAAIISLTAAPFFGGAMPVNWVNFIVVTLATTFALSAIASLIGQIAGSAQSTVLWSQLIFLPSMLLGGLMMPLSALPESVGLISRLLPATYAMQAYQGLAFNQSTMIDSSISLAVLVIIGIVFFAASIYFFKWDTQNHTQSRSERLGLLSSIGRHTGNR